MKFIIKRRSARQSKSSPKYLPLLRGSEGRPVGGLAAPIGASEGWHVSALVEGLSLLVERDETSLVRRHSKVIDSVRISEEAVIFRVLLHISPPAMRPAARYQVKLLPAILHVGVIHVVKLGCVDHFSHVLASDRTGCILGLIRALPKVCLLCALECRSRIQVISFGSEDIVTIGSQCVEAARAEHVHLTRSSVWRGSFHFVVLFCSLRKLTNLLLINQRALRRQNYMQR